MAKYIFTLGKGTYGAGQPPVGPGAVYLMNFHGELAVDYLLQEIENKEDYLGSPSISGSILASTSDGPNGPERSWIEAPFIVTTYHISHGFSGYRLRTTSDVGRLSPTGHGAWDLVEGKSGATDYGVTGFYAFGHGLANRSSGRTAAVFGEDNTNTGDWGFLAGQGNFSRGHGEAVFGTFSTEASQSGPDRRMFAVGIGDDDSNRKNGIEILKTGQVFLPELTTAMITNASSGRIVATRDYVDSNQGSRNYVDSTGNGLTGTQNGTNVLFTVSEEMYLAGSLHVTVGGFPMAPGHGITETDPANGTFSFDVAPLVTDVIIVQYSS